MAVTTAIAAVAGVGYQIYSGEQAKNRQKQALQMQSQANEDARQTAQAEADRADIEYNRAVRKQPEVAAIVSRSEQAAKSGPASTILTGNNATETATNVEEQMSDANTYDRGTTNPAAAEVANNRAADAKNRQGKKGMGSGSLLTGQIGVDPSLLNLSSNTLLGS
mgnify:CR=1 FL=1